MSVNAWLTPDASQLTESQDERIISLPGSLWYLVGGALDLLADVANWETAGDSTPEDTAQFFADILEDFHMSAFRNVGMISSFTSALFPAGWLGMNGQTVAQGDYPELTAVVPDSWKSGSNLIIPSTRGRFLRDTPVGGSQGASGGGNTHTLTVNEMPTHTHEYLIRAGVTPVVAGAGILPWVGNSFPQTGETGGGQPHNNMPEYVTVRFAVYAGR